MENFPRSTLLFTDTDSLAYQVLDTDVPAELKKLSDEFDFSAYPADNPLHSNVNRKVIGKFKDELCGNVMEKFVGLRSKLYAYTYVAPDGSTIEHKTAKGVPHRVKKTAIHFQDYYDTLHVGTPKSVTFNMIRSFNHQLYTCSTRKVALSRLDNKRWICPDGVFTRSHGHYKNV